MFAVIRTGGKQYKVAANDVIEIERLDSAPGATVEFADVLMLGGEGAPVVGTPLVAGATVAAEVVSQVRGEKIIVFKKKRRKHYRRRNGHRQLLTKVRIVEILTEGRKPAAEKSETAAPHPFPLPASGERVPPSESGGRVRGGAEPEAAEVNPAAPQPVPLSASGERMPEGRVRGEAEPTRDRTEAEAAPAEPQRADDLSLISGIGPKILKTLTELGYTTFRQIAELTPQQIDELEAALKMKGRVAREEWPDQARELMAGGRPRAKAERTRPGARKAAETPAKKDNPTS